MSERDRLQAAPIQGRAPRCRRSCADATTTRTMLAGMAKPMPFEPPEREKIAVLMPTSSPLRSTSAPPELPGIDRGVGLDEELVVGDADLRARQRRDDAVRHRLPDAERIADGEHQVADLQLVGIRRTPAPGTLARASIFQHREVRALSFSTILA